VYLFCDWKSITIAGMLITCPVAYLAARGKLNPLS